MLDEHDLAVIVFDDVVAAEPIAVLIEIVGALGARVALDAQDRLADFLRLKTLSVAASIDLMNLRVPAIATPLTKRRIGYDEIEGFVVSTIFLGVNHGFGRGRPLWFETLVFRQGTASRVIAE
jgi:hypothetical protein